MVYILKKTKKKLREINLGKKHTEDSKEKMRLNGKGKGIGLKLTEETKQKISIAHKGKVLSEQTKKLISLAQKQPILDGIALENWIKENNLTLAKLSLIINIDRKTISYWKKQKSGISLESRKKWIKYLGFDPVEKFGVNKNED